MTIESRFDVPFVADMALREKQIQQNHRPIIGVHKWFARRPGTLFRGLLLAEFGSEPLRDSFYRSNDLSGTRIADPFMGGGTPLIEANRLGCDVLGFDVNPMSAWIVREELERLAVPAYDRAAQELIATLSAQVYRHYLTSCPTYGDSNLPVKSFLWVKVMDCEFCGNDFDLFPGYLVAEARRHPRTVLVCPDCGELNEVDDRKNPGRCADCEAALRLEGPARRGRCRCPHCGGLNVFPGNANQPPRHRLFAIEYHNRLRKRAHKGRFFKKPDADDLARFHDAEERWTALAPRFVPEGMIPPGDETSRLHRWGYARYRDMFNARQLLGLELSCRYIAELEDSRLRRALATNLSDLVRYQNLLCRYDSSALKALDVFSVHGFPVGLIQCESNILGIPNGPGVNVGSGGWTNIVSKFRKAKQYCDAPFEVRREGTRNVRVPTVGEWIGEERDGRLHSVTIRCMSATDVELPANSLDAVFTDPPYLGNVQYAELMDFCYVWLRGLMGSEPDGFARVSTRSPDELTCNETEGRDLVDFATGLSAAFSRMSHALKPGAPLAFTFHHNDPTAYSAIGMAILDAGLACTGSLPCPAEMAGSIHIHGTGSSIVDTVFVCRSMGSMQGRWLFDSLKGLARVVGQDVRHLSEAGRDPTAGDVKCIVSGHLIRMAVWKLRGQWDESRPAGVKLAAVADEMRAFGHPSVLAKQLAPGGRAGDHRGSATGTMRSEERLHSDIPF